MMKKIVAFVVALAIWPAFAQSITPQIGGGIGNAFDGGISGGKSASAPFVPLSGSAFDMNFATNQYSVASLSNLAVTRAQTVSSYVDNSDGTVTAFSANTLRIASGKGLLIEEARTNIALQSGDVSNAAWSTFVTGSGTITRTGASGTAPDGTNTATLISLNRSSSSDTAEIAQTFTGTAAAYSGGFYVKASSNSDIGKQIQVGLFNGSTSTLATAILTGGWQRVQIPNVTLAASAACQIILGYLNSPSTGTGAVNFLAWGGQAELGASLSSYIPTAAASVTRNADAVTASGIVLTTYQSAALTQYARVVNANGAAGARLGASFGSSVGGNTPAFLGSSTTASVYNGSVLATATVGNGVNFGISNISSGPVNVVSSFGSGVSSVASGGAEVTAAGSFSAVSVVNLGSDAGAGSFLNGYLMRLAGWNSQLASGTRIALSATFNTTSATVGGLATNYLVPNNVPLSGTFVMYHHGVGETETSWTADSLKIGVREALLAQGHILSASNAAGDNWGNSAGLAAYAAQWADVQTRYAPSKLVFLSQSMGGETGLLTVAAATMPVRGWYGIYPTCNLAAEYALSFTAAINTAYNIPGGGTYAAQTAGHDPVLLTGSLFTIRMRFVGSAADTTVPVSSNGVQMQTLIAPTATESFLLQSLGVHGDPSNFLPYDVVNFFARS